MTEGTFVIRNKLGLHVKPAAVFTQAAGKFKSSIKVSKNDVEVNGKSIMGLLLLEAAQGSKIRVVAEGVDETEAVAALGKVITGGFNEI